MLKNTTEWITTISVITYISTYALWISDKLHYIFQVDTVKKRQSGSSNPVVFDLKAQALSTLLHSLPFTWWAFQVQGQSWSKLVCYSPCGVIDIQLVSNVYLTQMDMRSREFAIWVWNVQEMNYGMKLWNRLSSAWCITIPNRFFWNEWIVGWIIDFESH